jgi:tRNA-Thr(GGU) m(6)t(6)A37 methyltransferase TsaA
MKELSPLALTPIGIYHSEAKAPYEAARQPLDRIVTLGEVRLLPGKMFEQALEDLDGFERIWLIYQFHHNPNWKPKVLPPRGRDTKVGVFATRAPYRPNPLGLSCVKLVKVHGLALTVSGTDLLDGTPIFDIKPYLPYADSFPESSTGWLGTPEPWTVSFSPRAKEQVDFLASQGLSQLQDFIVNQLEHDPLNADKKRVVAEGAHGVLSYKTWRVDFSFDEAAKTIAVTKVFSGYRAEELLLESEDRYQDKGLHRSFRAKYETPSKD